MLIKRKCEDHLAKLAAEMPVVTVYGPRQSGKTTLVRKVFPTYSYANLEHPVVRDLARGDAEGFFKRFPPPVVIDEVQRVPELLSWIQVKSDEEGGISGQYILTGSHQPLLLERVTQSLAGRTALMTLLPLSIEELSAADKHFSAENAIATGFLPRVHANKISAADIYEDYYRTYVERDVRQLINVEDQIAFETFVRLLAGRAGQLVNFDGMAGEVGVSAKTVKKWLSVLEASFIVFRLQPYHANIGKRLVKSAKVYFTDVGLAAHLLGIVNAEYATAHPLFGGLFENMVVSEAMKWKAAGRHAERFWFLRDSNGAEVDLVMEQSGRLHLMEIKGAMTPNRDMARNFAKYEAVVPVASKTVFYRGENFPIVGGGSFVHFAAMSARLDELAESG